MKLIKDENPRTFFLCSTYYVNNVSPPDSADNEDVTQLLKSFLFFDAIKEVVVFPPTILR